MKRFRDLDPKDFRGATVFLDIDGTLLPDGEETPAPAEAQVLSALTAVAHVYLLASKGFDRIPALAGRYGAEAIVTAFMKPSKRIIEGIALPPRPRFVVGDKILTDGWFASRIDAQFVKVARLENGNESVAVTCFYALDALAWAGASLGHAVVSSTLWLYVRVARPSQWRKNLLMLVPAFLAGQLVDPSVLTPLLFAVIAFSASASVSYVVNDIIDCEVDAKHPTKRSRPIACGLVHVPNALFYAIFLAAIAVAAAAAVPSVIPYVMGYLVLTHAYTFYLKRFPVFELFAVSGFYLLRIVGGAAVAGIPTSAEFFLVVLCASLMVAAGGRYLKSTEPYPPAVVAQYPRDFLKLSPLFFGMLTVFVYALATPFFVTVPLVLFSVTWYLRSIMLERPSAEDRLWDGIVLWGSLAILMLILGLPFA